MVDRTTRLRWRRRLRRGKRQVEDLSYQAEDQLERHFFKRLNKLPGILRFSITWILLLVILIGGLIVQTRALSNYYLVNQPVPGGTYTEGILGTFTNANPLYASGPVDAGVSRLVFAGLLKQDVNNKLVGELADKWSVDDSELNYTVHLRPNLTWQDGQPLTSQDVVFTYKEIQNPDTKSPLFNAWKDIKVSALDNQTIVFSLPDPLSSFPLFMTNGIVPMHLLKNVDASQLRSISFNTVNPIGSGPFKWSAIQVSGQTPQTREEQIALTPFSGYVGGKPKLNKFVIRSFLDEGSLVNSFIKQELNGVAGLSTVPSDLEHDSNVREYSTPLLSGVYVFLKTTQVPLVDVKVRQALVIATNVPKVIETLGYPVAVVHGPLLKSQLGYDKKYNQSSFDLSAAKKLLDSDGWAVGSDGIRVKNGQRLSFGLSSQDNRDYVVVTKELQSQWRDLGVDLSISTQSADDLKVKLAGHSYDALLYGIELGTDPDVFPYWDSSQADIRSDTRLNFSEYKSSVADTALEAGRTRLDPVLRTIKYRPFLDAWRNDAPAIGLYQPRFLYLTRGQLFGFEPTSLTSGIDRYANVTNWMIHQDKLPK